MKDADVELILDAACRTTANTVDEVVALLERAAARARRLKEDAEAVQSRRKGDPGTGRVEAIYYVPEAEAARCRESGIPFSAVPSLVLAEARTFPQA